jgi:hypothetical protein
LRLIVLACLLCACAFGMGCGSGADKSAAGALAIPAAPAVPDDIAAVAHGALGNEGEALAWGDLAMDGRQEVLAVNRIGGAQGAPNDEIFLTRLTVVENVDGNWSQVLMCDEHLKNEKGYLIGSPGQAISRWKLTFVKDPAKGLMLSLTPMGQGSDALGRTIHVLWNPKAARYQALLSGSEKFAGEVGSPETVQRRLN